MTKVTIGQQEKSNVLIETIQDKYKVVLNYSSDNEIYKTLNESGLPSLITLLKLTVKK